MFEFAADPLESGAYSFEIEKSNLLIVDWKPVFREILRDLAFRTAPGVISAKFHNGLVNLIREIARDSGSSTIVLSGGCFQNIFLLEKAISILRSEGFNVYWQKKVPTNDGGIALGQLSYALNQMRK